MLSRSGLRAATLLFGAALTVPLAAGLAEAQCRGGGRGGSMQPNAMVQGMQQGQTCLPWTSEPDAGRTAAKPDTGRIAAAKPAARRSTAERAPGAERPVAGGLATAATADRVFDRPAPAAGSTTASAAKTAGSTAASGPVVGGLAAITAAKCAVDGGSATAATAKRPAAGWEVTVIHALSDGVRFHSPV